MTCVVLIDAWGPYQRAEYDQACKQVFRELEYVLTHRKKKLQLNFCL